MATDEAAEKTLEENPQKYVNGDAEGSYEDPNDIHVEYIVEDDNLVDQNDEELVGDEEENWDLEEEEDKLGQFSNVDEEEPQRPQSPIVAVVNLSAPNRPTDKDPNQVVPQWDRFIPSRDHIVAPEVTHVCRWVDADIVAGQFDDADD